LCGGFFDAAVQEGGCSVIERVSNSSRRPDPIQSMNMQRQLGEERRADRHRVDGRPEIVNEAR
jgi:hypothetical protein